MKDKHFLVLETLEALPIITIKQILNIHIRCPYNTHNHT